MQKLLVPEVLALEKRIAEGKDIPGFDEYLIRDSVGDHVASLLVIRPEETVDRNTPWEL